MSHPQVPHPAELRREVQGKVAAANDFLATHLAVIFGIAWTIWVFFIVPVVAYFLPQDVQNHIFFFSSGWIQLFALPLMVYVSNKIQKSSDAQSDAFHQALTHIATVEDLNRQLITEMQELLTENTNLTRAVKEVLDNTGNVDCDTKKIEP